MTTGKSSVTAGLVFLGLRDLDIVKIGNRASRAFDSLDQTVTGIRILSDKHAVISSLNHDVEVMVKEDQPVFGLDQPAPLFLSLEVSPGCAATTDTPPRTDAVLAHALKAIQHSLSADLVQWIRPEAVLSSADFAIAIEPATFRPEPVASAAAVALRHNLPSIEETTELLHNRLTQKDVLAVEEESAGAFRDIFRSDPDEIGIPLPEPEDIREDTAPLRLSVWLISFTISIFALPVGVALLVFNLLRGENLRLSSQTAALTGMFLAFQAFGTTAQAMDTLQNLMG